MRQVVDKIALVFAGLKTGPIAYLVKDGLMFESSVLTDANNEWRQRTEQLNEHENFGKCMQEFFESQGFEVIYNEWSLNESMSLSQKKDFVKKLKAGEVNFKFKKRDGSTRIARGTLSKKLMPKEVTDKQIENAKKKRHVPETQCVFWDLDKNSFRSFRIDNFINIINNNSKKTDNKKED